jgi:4-hydroxyphenylpyruvate dioxygenase
MEPTTIEDKHGKIIKATVGTFGDTVHSFVQRENYNGTFFPTYSPINRRSPSSFNGLMSIDHIAVCLQDGDLDRWVSFYEEAFDFHQSHREDIATEYSAMNSKVVQSRDGRIKFPMMEPAHGKRKSQIQEYLKFYGGPGVQHVALLSDDIVKSVQTLRANGIEFLSTPESYYIAVQNNIGRIEEDIELIRQHNILIDRDERGYLMQIFTKPLQGRPTLFFEIIYRNGATGFGSGNIRALFEAIERELEHQTAMR